MSNPAFFDELISARTVIDLCPGSGEFALACLNMGVGCLCTNTKCSTEATSSVLEEKTKELQDFAAQRRKMIRDSISRVLEEKTVPEMTNILKSTRDSAN